MRLKQYDKALEVLQRRMALNPIDIEAYNMAGLINLQRKDGKAARRCFAAALALSPRNPAALAGLRALPAE